MSGCLELAAVKEANGSETAKDMVRSVVADYRQLILELKQGMDLAANANDEISGDMLLAIYSELEKHAWMLQSFLG